MRKHLSGEPSLETATWKDNITLDLMDVGQEVRWWTELTQLHTKGGLWC